VRRACLALATIVALSGCARSQPAPAPAVQPIADCITEADQRANGATLTRPDGHTVKALVHGSGRTAIVFANQVDLDLCEWLPFDRNLADKGYLTVVFEYSGENGAEQDVLAGAATARKRGATAIVLVGASKGGTAVLSAAAQAQPPVAGVVSLSGPSTYPGISPTSMAQFTTPVLFIAGINDDGFTDAARLLYDACAAKDKQLVLRPNGLHGAALLEPAVSSLLQDFIASHSAS
jgi:fermentation-respiration switch protein FrsA (DUF1100 family)